MIHCSTAIVVGRAHETNVDKDTICHPTDTYTYIKLTVERVLLEKYGDQFETLILSLTAIFVQVVKTFWTLQMTWYMGTVLLIILNLDC